MALDPLSLFALDAHPERTAILWQKGAVTRREILLEASAMADALEAVSAGEHPVVVALDSGPGFLASVVGAWMARCTPILLDPLARRELGRAIARTGARAVVRSALATDAGDFGDVPTVSPRGERSETPRICPPIDDEAPLLYLYTSGSTGEPAIVAKTFEQLEAEYRFYAGFFGEGLRVATLAPWCHILGFVVSLLVPIRSGGLCDLVAGISPKTLLDRVSSGLVDIAVAVPAILRVMLRILEEGEPRSFPPGCRFCVSGAPLSADLRRRFVEATGVELVDVYGSTEAGGVAYRLDDGPWIPKPHVEIRFSDDGALEVRSPAVSQTVAPRGAFFGMGDLAHPVGAGFALEGRSDDVVKIGGRRISLDEIRQTLETFPGISAAAVAVEDVRGETRLVAFVESASKNLSAEAIKAYVRERLADYKVPRAVHAVRSFPTNTGGKVDRRRLLAELAQKG